jgi:hypothetical protein
MCTCTCCEDALERLRFDCELRDACDCLGSPEWERCECEFCLWVMSVNR